MAYLDLLELFPQFSVNVALLLALALLYSLLGLPLLRRAGHVGAVIAGLLFGGSAILATQWPIQLTGGYALEGHNLIILAAGAFGGPWAGGVAALTVIANSIFVGDTLLTAGNPGEDADARLFQRLGLKPMPLATDAAADADATEGAVARPHTEPCHGRGA